MTVLCWEHLGTVVMPQLESCGWETWFSLQYYGTDLSKLKAPCVPRKSQLQSCHAVVGDFQAGLLLVGC